MSEPILIRVADLINSPRAVDAADGERVFKEVCPLLKAGQKVQLSFDGVTMVITAFLNASIGKLYGEISGEKITELLEVSNLREAFLSSLDNSIKWSKAYYQNRERMEQAIEEELQDEK
jgi:STAS-like domain of unknown function (DUF4325)